jgi:hypothetical protein
LQYVYNLPSETKKLLGKQARQFVIDNYSIEVVGKYFEDLFDSLPEVEYQFENKKIKCNPFCDIDENQKDKEWVESLYNNILMRKDPAGVAHWVQRLNSDLKRTDVLNYFRKTALNENQNAFLSEMLESLNNNKNTKKIAFIQPEGAEEVIIATSLIPSIKKLYPEHDIYFFTKSEYFDIINSHPDVKKVLNHFDKMNDPLFFEGKGSSVKYFDIVYAPYLSINNNYFRNGEDKLQYNVYESN